MEPDPLLRAPADQSLESQVDRLARRPEIPLAVGAPGHADGREDRDAVAGVRFHPDRQRDDRGARRAGEAGRPDRRPRGNSEERGHDRRPAGSLIAEDPDDLAVAQRPDRLEQAPVPRQGGNADRPTSVPDEPIEVGIPQAARHHPERKSTADQVGGGQLPVADVARRHDDAPPAAERLEEVLLPLHADQIEELLLPESPKPEEVDGVAA